MKRREALLLVGAILMAGTAAFCVGRTTTARRQGPAAGAQTEWLADVPEAVTAEQRFAEQAGRLADALRQEQAALAAMLPDIHVTGEQVLSQVDNVTQAHALLARAVGGHLVRLRHTLPEPQGQRLMLSCAESVQGSMQRRYRWRGGAQDPGEGFPGGRGGGPGRGEGGRGAGFRQQYRGGRSNTTSGLALRLRLTDEQVTWSRQQDPDFEDQCARLKDRLHEAHADLAAGFRNAGITEEEFTAKVEGLLQAHDALEKRVARHIVLLRPHLSPEQRSLLSLLSCSNADGRAARIDPLSGGDIVSSLACGRMLADLL
ncbi:MAG: hypothetical protein FJ280_29920 [Planctomycetes bacterium]|nr:hypothetical protein [Planctomycetota bacterium]